MSRDGRYLYVRSGASTHVAIFRIGADGSLSMLESLDGTTTGLAGLAGY